MKSKSLLFALILVLLGLNVSVAQDIKPAAGSVDLELMFTPLGDSPIGLSYLKGRYYITDDLAARLGLDFDLDANKSEPFNDTDNDVKDEETMSSLVIGIWPGLEMHFGDFERVSPYIGAEVGVNIKGASYTYTDNVANQTMEINGAWGTEGSNRGYTQIGVNLVSGFDYFFVKKAYLGAEFGFGFFSTTWSEIEVTTGSQTNVVLNKSTNVDVGFNVVSAIRLGYSF